MPSFQTKLTKKQGGIGALVVLILVVLSLYIAHGVTNKKWNPFVKSYYKWSKEDRRHVSHVPSATPSSKP